MAGLGINLGYLLVQIFNFLIIATVIYLLILKPIVNLLNKRRAAVAQGLEDARVAAEARANAEKEAQEIIAKAQSEANAKVREATERAEEAGKGVIAVANADAEKIRQAAQEEARLERERALSEVRGQIAALAIAATQKLVGEALDEKRQHTLIQEFFSGVKSGRITVLEGATVSGVSAEVTSALPLTADEKESVRKDILSKLGESATVAFRVDPQIMGGLVVRVGDKVLDGSVAGQLESLRTSLK
ncbi:MAG: atpF atpH [Chloroflexi bacterium]|nr:atpF atpH [Chloroflexota bacterium]